MRRSASCGGGLHAGAGSGCFFGPDDVLKGVPVVLYLPGPGLKTFGISVCHPVVAEFASQVWLEGAAQVRRLLSLL